MVYALDMLHDKVNKMNEYAFIKKCGSKLTPLWRQWYNKSIIEKEGRFL